MGDTAKYDGVLVPPLNYKNYKTFEKELPEVRKLATIQIIQAEHSQFWNYVLCTLGGAAVAALVVTVTH